MYYQETQRVRALKHCKPSASSIIIPETSNGTLANIEQQELLQRIKEQVGNILERFEELLKNRGKESPIPFEEFRDAFVTLNQEFLQINFEETDERIEVASDVLFKKAFMGKEFRFDEYFKLIAGLRRQSMVTAQKFLDQMFNLCDQAVYSFTYELTEKSDPKQESKLICRMLDELFEAEILSIKAMVEYIHLLINPAVRSNGIIYPIFELLKTYGAKLDHAISEAEIYRKGMIKLGKNLDWFEDFKTLDSVFEELKKMSLDSGIPERMSARLKMLCSARESNWKTSDEKLGSDSNAHTSLQEQRRNMLEQEGFGINNEAGSSNSDSEEESSGSDSYESGTNEVTRPVSELAEYFEKLTVGNPLSPQEMESLKNDLMSRKDYFHSWLGDYPITAQNLGTITKALYQFVGRPKTVKFEDIFDEEGMTTLQQAASPLVEGFMNMKLGNLQLTKSNVMWVEKLIEHFLKSKVISEDYCSGLTYLCTLLKIDWSLQEKTTTEEAARSLETAKFDLLKPKGQSIVWIARWMFDQAIHDRKRDATEHLLKARDLDPGNWVWNYVLCSRLRFQRRQGFSTQSMPGKVEFEAILNAVELNPVGSLYRAMCISGLCQSLAEMLRYRTIRRINDDTINIRTRILKSNSSIKDYIFEEAGNALEGQTVSFAEYIRYGEILSSILPNEYRDYDLAELCYGHCLDIMPRNSKALHRMGLLQVVGKQDAGKAVQYFRGAVTAESGNYPAWMDLLQTLLGTLVEADDNVGSTFKQVLEMDSWNETQLSNLHFLYGCYYWLLKNKASAIETWMKIRHQDSDHTNFFQRLSSMQKRYQWPKVACFSAQEVWEEIEVYSKSRSCGKEILILKGMVADCIHSGSPRKARFQQQDYQNSNTGYNSRTRTTSGSGDNEYVGRRGSDLGPRPKPVSVADQDSSWRTSEKSIPIPASGSQPRNDQRRDSYGTGKSPGNYQYGNSPRNFFNSRPWENSNRGGRQGYDRQNRSPSPDSWR